MTTSLELVLQSSVGVTVAALMAWAAAALGRRRSATFRNAVWRGAVAAFWVVPLVCVAAAALPLQTPSVRVPVPAVQVGAGGAPVTGRSEGPPVLTADGGVRGAPVQWTAWSTAPLRLVVGAVWVLGALIALGFLVRDALTVRRLVRTAVPVGDGQITDRVAHWAGALGLSAPPRSALAPSVQVPTVAGVRRPTLLLPANLAAEAPETDSVLIHEIAHVVRGDVWLQAVASLTRVVWWWHPLAWVAAARLASTAEECCDDWVVATTGDREGYAGAVVRWAEAAHTAGTLACGSRGRALIQRVQRILTAASRPAVRLSGRAKLALAALAVVVLAATGALRIQAVPAAPSSNPTIPMAPMPPALESALQHSSVAEVRAALDAGAPVSSVDDRGDTALHRMGRSRRPEAAAIIKLLVERGADLNAPDRAGRTPLVGAIFAPNPAGVEALLIAGSDPNRVDTRSGQTPLMLAVSVRAYWDTVPVLVEHGADMNAQDEHGNTALGQAARAENQEAVAYLLAHGAKPTAPDAATIGDVAAIRKALDEGTDVNRLYPPREGGVTLLHLAAMTGQVEVGKLLLERGADPNKPGVRQMTPLHQAASAGKLEFVRLLLDHGGDPDAPWAGGTTPLDMAAYSLHADVVKLMLERGATWTPEAAVLLDNPQKLHELLEAGVRPHIPVDDWSAALLAFAATAGAPEPAKVLLDHGAHLNPRDTSYQTPLTTAVLWGHVELVRLFVERGADANAKWQMQTTPLHAVASGHSAMDGGPDPRTDATRAAMAELLLEHGAKVNAPMEGGNTPLDLVREEQFPQLAEVLKQHGARRSPPAPAAPPRRGTSATAPGTTIHVIARGEDGSRPVGARCTIALRDRQAAPDTHTDYDVSWGAAGDWAIYGVREGTWTVSVTAEGYAWYEAANTRQVHAGGEGEQWVRLTLSRGGTLTGRVVAADTGKAIPGVLLTSGPLTLKRAETDANGRYRLEHVAPVSQVVEAYWTPGFYIGRRSAAVTGRTGKSIAVPDIRLPVGGIIEGRVNLPPEGCDQCNAHVTVTPERPVAPDLALSVGYPSRNAFRLGPLPPGSYTVAVEVSHGKGPRVTPPHEWGGRLAGITVKAKQRVEGVVVPVGPKTG